MVESSNNPPQAKRRQKIQKLRTLLCERNLNLLRLWAKKDRGVLMALCANLLETDDLLRWRTIETLGVVAADIAQRDLAKIRDLIRRQFWAMNDDSGNIAWYAPEAIGEMLHNVPELALEFTTNLASYAQTYPFQAGVHWALSRLAESQKSLVTRESETLIDALTSELAAVRGYAAKTLGILKIKIAIPALERLLEDKAEVLGYDFINGELSFHAVGVLGRLALEEILS